MRIIKYTSYAILVSLLVAVAGGTWFWQQGYRVFAVKTGSMAPTYPTGSLVVDAPTRNRVPDVGDVITFRAGGVLVTHRVHGTATGGVTTKGDANESPDAWTIVPEQVVGTVSRGVEGGGYVLVFLQQPTGIPSVALMALSVAFAWALFFSSSTGDPGSGTDRSPPRHRSRRRLLPGTSVVAGLTLAVGLSAAALGSWSAAEPTAAWFTDSVEGTMALSIDCDDRHENGNHSGNGHDRCHGNGHTTPPKPEQPAVVDTTAQQQAEPAPTEPAPSVPVLSEQGVG